MAGASEDFRPASTFARRTTLGPIEGVRLATRGSCQRSAVIDLRRARGKRGSFPTTEGCGTPRPVEPDPQEEGSTPQVASGFPLPG
jgi:hypothetical protein